MVALGFWVPSFIDENIREGIKRAGGEKQVAQTVSYLKSTKISETKESKSMGLGEAWLLIYSCDWQF